jgi:hypothetical protein
MAGRQVRAMLGLIVVQPGARAEARYTTMPMFDLVKGIGGQRKTSKVTQLAAELGKEKGGGTWANNMGFSADEKIIDELERLGDPAAIPSLLAEMTKLEEYLAFMKTFSMNDDESKRLHQYVSNLLEKTKRTIWLLRGTADAQEASARETPDESALVGAVLHSLYEQVDPANRPEFAKFLASAPSGCEIVANYANAPAETAEVIVSLVRPAVPKQAVIGAQVFGDGASIFVKGDLSTRDFMALTELLEQVGGNLGYEVEVAAGRFDSAHLEALS